MVSRSALEKADRLRRRAGGSSWERRWAAIRSASGTVPPSTVDAGVRVAITPGSPRAISTSK